MKNLYLVTIAICALQTMLISPDLYAQCSCSGGVPANTITYLDTLATTNASVSTINFPKFDPSIGTLSCATFDDTISGVTTTNVWNLASVKTEYQFLLTVSNHFSGPGLSITQAYSQTYGPDSLSAYGQPGDSIQYGPDNLFTNAAKHTNITSNLSSYLGTTGNVSFSYTLNGGLISLEGSLNYGDQIVTNYWGTFRLTYYWCPSAILQSTISDFTAAKNGNHVQLKWEALYEQKDISYVVEYSTDGNAYAEANTQKANPHADGTPASYHFQFDIPGNLTGKLFFRVKRISADGSSIIYSPIKIVNLNNATGYASYQTYPNPVRNFAMIESDQVLTGEFAVDIVNITGQIVQHKEVSLAGSNQIRLDLTRHLAPGLYYLHVNDKMNNHQFITKLVVE